MIHSTISTGGKIRANVKYDTKTLRKSPLTLLTRISVFALLISNDLFNTTFHTTAHTVYEDKMIV